MPKPSSFLIYAFIFSTQLATPFSDVGQRLLVLFFRLPIGIVDVFVLPFTKSMHLASSCRVRVIDRPLVTRLHHQHEVRALEPCPGESAAHDAR